MGGLLGPAEPAVGVGGEKLEDVLAGGRGFGMGERFGAAGERGGRPAHAELEPGHRLEVAHQAAAVAGQAVVGQRPFEGGLDPGEAAAPQQDLGEVRKREGQRGGAFAVFEQAPGVARRPFGAGEVAGHGAGYRQVVPQPAGAAARQAPAAGERGLGGAGGAQAVADLLGGQATAAGGSASRAPDRRSASRAASR